MDEEKRVYAEEYEQRAKSYDNVTVRDSAIRQKMTTLEKAINTLGEQNSSLISMIAPVRRILPTSEGIGLEQGDRQQQSELAHQLDTLIEQVNRISRSISEAQDELEL